LGNFSSLDESALRIKAFFLIKFLKPTLGDFIKEGERRFQGSLAGQTLGKKKLFQGYKRFNKVFFPIINRRALFHRVSKGQKEKPGGSYIKDFQDWTIKLGAYIRKDY